jgi:hypothetical protein
MSDKPKDLTLKRKKQRSEKRGNPVAKNMNTFNKPSRHKDKRNDDPEYGRDWRWDPFRDYD